jgi:hypothetical protein
MLRCYVVEISSQDFWHRRWQFSQKGEDMTTFT